MAVPKRKTSKQRKRKRRTHWKLQSPGANKCSHCGAPLQPHRVCGGCGHYGGRRVVEATD